MNEPFETIPLPFPSSQRGLTPIPSQMEQTVKWLSEILRDKAKWEALFKLESSDTQSLIDGLNYFLSDPTFRSKAEPWLIKYTVIALRKLCTVSALYPTCYVLEDIQDISSKNGGGFCDIHQGRSGNQLLCLKVVRLYRDSNIERLLKAHAREAILWSQLDHPNIVPFYGIFYLDKRERICLVSPWMENGDITEYLEKVPDAPRKLFVHDIASGLQYLHELNIVHGDLKGRNVLIDGYQNACLADFGLSTVVTDQTLGFTRTASGPSGHTTRWASPELLEDGARPTCESDLWAFGCVCYEVLTGHLPFAGCSEVNVVFKLVKRELPADLDNAKLDPEDGFNQKLSELVRGCWSIEVTRRPACQAILQILEEVTVVQPSRGPRLESFTTRNRLINSQASLRTPALTQVKAARDLLKKIHEHEETYNPLYRRTQVAPDFQDEPVVLPYTPRAPDAPTVIDVPATLDAPSSLSENTRRATSTPAQRPRAHTRRPASITELAQQALAVELDLTQEFKKCLKETQMWRNKGRDCLEKGDLEQAFMLFARSATMALDTLPLHPQYMTNLKEHQRQNLSWHGQEILDQMGEIKPILVHRFSEWRTARINELLTPLDHLDDEAPEEADRNRSQRERAKVEEAAQLRRQQEDTQRHADELRLLQRSSSSRNQLDRRKDNALNAAGQTASASRYNPPEADYASRPPNVNGLHGSQNTIVVMPDPSGNRDKDERRRIEQEGIKRRQQEAEVEAQQIRQVIAVNNSLPHRPHYQQPQPESHSLSKHSSGSSFATNASSQSSLFPQSQPSSIATTPASSSYHTQSHPSQPPPPTTNTPAAAAAAATIPVRMATQADVHYPQTTNTQPRKGLIKPDISVLFPGSSPVDVGRAPTRAMLRPGFAPPSTTTSPQPLNSATTFPSLMSPHQQQQGYHPSGGSMFFADMDRLSLDDGRYPSIANVFGGGSNTTWAPEANKSAVAADAAQFSQRMIDGGERLRKRSGSNKYNTSAPFPAAAQPQKYMPMPRPPLSAIAAARKILEQKLPLAANQLTQGNKLKTTGLPRETLPRFLAIAKLNTSLNRETCGLLLGKEVKPGEGSPPRDRHRSSTKSEYIVTTLLIPKQHGTSDMCTMDGEELVLSFTEERSLITLGWIHTHPSQSCFMSSVDLHTHSGFQKMLPESIAVVCAPKSNPNFGIFRLTDPPGLPTILSCQEKDAFHPHPDLPIYTDADKGHVQMRDGPLEIIDLR